MKAKVFANSEKAEIVLENEEKKTYKVNLQEDYTVEDFIEDVKEKVTEEFGEDLDVKIEDETYFKRLKPASLEKRAASAEGLEAELIAAALGSQEGKGGKTKKPAKEKKPKAEKPKKELTPDQKERAAALEEAKGGKEYKAARKNIGKVASFTAKRAGKKLSGEIKGLSFSKDLKRVYYTVKAGDKTTCVAVNNESLEIA